MIRVTHSYTNAESPLWSRDMTDEQYDRYLDQGRKAFEQWEREFSQQALLSRISELALELAEVIERAKVVDLTTERELMGLLRQYESRMVVRGESHFPF